MQKSILQTKEWAQLKEKYGQRAHWLSDVLFLEHKLPFKHSFLYAPEVDQVQLHDMDKSKLDTLARETKAVFVRAEVVNATDEKERYFGEALKGFEKSVDEVQPKHRRIINLRPDEKILLEQMKQKGRYNIKVAERHDVTVMAYDTQNSHRGQNIKEEMQFWGKSEDKKSAKSESGNFDAVAAFYGLYQQTVKREKITGRSIDYFYDLVDILGARNMAKVYVATWQNTPLAAAIVTYCDGVASYLYGGSSSEHREVMAPFALHWQIIKDAKTNNFRYYDLLGIAPPEREKHKWAGLSRFKENFGGKAIEIIGGYDKVYDAKWYRLYKIFRGRE